jgi:hypothetical protein
MNRFIYGALGTLLLITLLLPGCSSGQSGTVTESKQIVITYTAIKSDELSGTYFQNKPQAGKVYLVLDITIENRSDEPFNIDPLGFLLVAKSVQYKRAFLFEVEDAIQLGIVPISGRVEGRLVFEVPEDIGSFDMQYNGDKTYNIKWVKQ